MNNAKKKYEQERKLLEIYRLKEEKKQLSELSLRGVLNKINFYNVRTGFPHRNTEEK